MLSSAGLELIPRPEYNQLLRRYGWSLNIGADPDSQPNTSLRPDADRNPKTLTLVLTLAPTRIHAHTHTHTHTHRRTLAP